MQKTGYGAPTRSDPKAKCALTRTDSEVRCKEIEIPSFVYPRSNISNMLISGILIYKYIDEVTKVEGRRAVSSIYRHINTVRQMIINII